MTGYFDTLVLGAFWPESQVGIYSAVLTIGRLIHVAANAVTYIFLPVAARLTGQGNIPTIGATYITTGRWIMSSPPRCFVFGLLPGDSLTVIFGTPYAAGSLALIIVTVAALGSVFVGPTNAALAGMGMTRPLLIAVVISGATNIVLSITLIPTFGLIGAAVAWSVARVAYPVAGAFSLESTHGVGSLRRSFLLPLAMSLGIGIPLFLLVGYLPHTISRNCWKPPTATSAYTRENWRRPATLPAPNRFTGGCRAAITGSRPPAGGPSTGTWITWRRSYRPCGNSGRQGLRSRNRRGRVRYV